MLKSEVINLQKYNSQVIDIQVKFSNFVDNYEKHIKVKNEL